MKLSDRSSQVPRAKRNPSGEDRRREDWLGDGAVVRARRWALEEELFGPSARRRMLEALETDIAEEQSELARLEEERQRQAQRIARSRARLAALRNSRSTRAIPTEAMAEPSLTTPPERSYALCRCEGFRVDSPTGKVGLVEGLRYQSRIDQPDALEVRAGWLGRKLLLIPVEDVDQIFVEEGRLVLRMQPAPRHDVFHELMARLRGATVGDGNARHHSSSR
jgi:hypothetical protein